MKSLKASNRIGGYWEDCQKARKEIQKMDLQLTYTKERDFQGRIASRLESYTFQDKLIDPSSTRDSISGLYLFGSYHYPDFAIGSEGTAIEVKLADHAGKIKIAIAQSLFYRMHYRFVIMVLIDTSDDGEMYNLIMDEGSQEAKLIKDLEESFNIFTVIKLGR